MSGTSKAVAPTLLLMALTAGCGSGAKTAIADAATPDASVCPFPPGKSFIETDLGLRSGDQGSDHDGDGVIDNSLGNLPLSVRNAIHDGFTSSIEAGNGLLAAHISDWSDPPTQDDPAVTLQIFTLIDFDQPPNPSNDRTGKGVFYADPFLVDLNCKPSTETDSASLHGGQLTAHAARWSFPLYSTGGGTMTLLDSTVTASLSPDSGELDGAVDFMASLCGLSHLPFPGPTTGSVLDALVNDPVINGSVKIDMDIDGDGLEQVIGDGVTVKQCIDGDGTVIEGPDCPCSPGIQDAISGSLALRTISITILGYR